MQKKSLIVISAFLSTTVIWIPSEALASDKRTLSVAVHAEFPPYEYCENQEIVGIDMEIAELIADELGMELDICNMAEDEIFDAVESGKVKIAIGRIVVPEEETEDLLFSDGYMNAEYAVVIPQGTETEVEELKGKKIGTADTLCGQTIAEENCENEAVCFENETDALEALKNEEIDALILDEKAARYFCNQSEDICILDCRSDEQKFVIAITKGQEELQTEINDALATMTETGELDKIVEKYLGEENQEEETEVS